MEKEYKLKRLLLRKCEEERNIMKAKDNWRTIRKKIKVIRMMGSFGGEFVQNKLSEKKPKFLDGSLVDDSLSRFIISPNNYWNMWWNNLT